MRPPNTPLTNVQSEISIHAPLAGCDPARPPRCTPASFISIHAPLAGCDNARVTSAPFCLLFQSTHPLRGATAASRLVAAQGRHFNPRTPCGVRPCRMRWCRPRCWEFQSTHPLRGATPGVAGLPSDVKQFHSPHPLRGATRRQRRARGSEHHISIHAPLAGCDTAVHRISAIV